MRSNAKKIYEEYKMDRRFIKIIEKMVKLDRLTLYDKRQLNWIKKDMKRRLEEFERKYPKELLIGELGDAL